VFASIKKIYIILFIVCVQLAVCTGWSLSLWTLYSVVYGMFDLVQFDHQYNAIETALYGALHRPAWAMAVAWVVFACQAGYGGAIYLIKLSNNI
jgi:hypothetical protein